MNFHFWSKHSRAVDQIVLECYEVTTSLESHRCYLAHPLSGCNPEQVLRASYHYCIRSDDGSVVS